LFPKDPLLPIPLSFNEAFNPYIRQTFALEDEVLVHIRKAISERVLFMITVQSEQGCFLQFLATVCDSHLALEIEAWGGYSGVWVEHGLASGGRLITIEKMPARVMVAREHFQSAGATERVASWLRTILSVMELLWTQVNTTQLPKPSATSIVIWQTIHTWSALISLPGTVWQSR